MRSLLLRATGSETQFWFHRPALRYAAALAAVVGALAAMVPTGVQGHRSPPGVLGGAGWGIAGAVLVWPLVAACAIAASVTEREAAGLAEAAVLSGVGRGRQAAAQGIAILLGTLAVTPVGLVAGGLVGLGDALRQSGPYLEDAHAPIDPAGAVVAAIYLAGIAVAVAAVTRRRVACFLGLAVSLIGFFAVVVATNRTGAWTWFARVFPWAPLWHAAHHSHDEFWLPMSTADVVAVALAWLLIALTASYVATRPGWTAGPAPQPRWRIRGQRRGQLARGRRHT